MKNHHNKPLPRVAEDHPVAAPPPPVAAGFDPLAAPSLPATIPFAPTAPPEIAPSHLVDAHGFDPAAYQWIPVLRRPRADGWTPQRQHEFIAALADCGCVAQAARECGMASTSCYRLRRAPGAENFAAAWDSAMAQASRRLVDLAFDRAINGSDEPIFDQEGNRIGRRLRHNDRLMMFLLKAYMPDRFRYAHKALRDAGEPHPLALPPVGEALLRLEPAPPADPHLLMDPDELGHQLDIADAGAGKLPFWHEGRRDLPRIEPVIDDLDSAPPPAFAADLERKLDEVRTWQSTKSTKRRSKTRRDQPAIDDEPYE